MQKPAKITKKKDIKLIVIIGIQKCKKLKKNTEELI